MLHGLPGTSLRIHHRLRDVQTVSGATLLRFTVECVPHSPQDRLSPGCRSAFFADLSQRPLRETYVIGCGLSIAPASLTMLTLGALDHVSLTAEGDGSHSQPSASAVRHRARRTSFCSLKFKFSFCCPPVFLVLLSPSRLSPSPNSLTLLTAHFTAIALFRV